MTVVSENRKVAFVGQTPPPFGGQAIMIGKILNGHFEGVELLHVRMSFSKDLDENGKLNLFKIFHLVEIIMRIFLARFKGARVLYYPPAGPEKIPIIRDIIILIATRWLFSRTIFHYHAGGLSEAEPSSPVLRWLFRAAYYRADCAILLSELNPPDGTKLKAKHQVVIPYGIEDMAGSVPIHRNTAGSIRILFVAVIRESKGILILLDACHQLIRMGLDIRLEVMGRFESPEFEERTRNLTEQLDLQGRVEFIGVQTGEPKWEAFRRADIFCFPTFFESETFGVVLLEAMQFQLPVVATIWRGIPSIVEEEKNGFLVAPKDSAILAARLETLVRDPALRKKMGEEGRRIFVQNFASEKFLSRMEQVFKTC